MSIKTLSLAVAIYAFVLECAPTKHQLGMCPCHVLNPPGGLYVPVLPSAVVKTTES